MRHDVTKTTRYKIKIEAEAEDGGYGLLMQPVPKQSNKLNAPGSSKPPALKQIPP